MVGPAESGDDADPDADAAVEALRRRAEGPLYSVVRFDADDFEPLYVAEETEELYPTGASMIDHFEKIFAYVGIDFAEKALFSDVLLPGAGTVRYMTTCLESVKVVRVYDGAVGVFLGVDPDEPVPPLVEAIEEHLFGFRDR